jgi:hypothetical protein
VRPLESMQGMTARTPTNHTVVQPEVRGTVAALRSSALTDPSVARGERVVWCGLPTVNVGDERSDATSDFGYKRHL